VWVRIDPAVTTALDAAPYVALSRLPGVQTAPNLALPAPGPAAGAGGPAGAAAGAAAGQQAAAAAAAAAAGGGAADGGLGAQPVLLPSERTPFRWRAVAEAQLLPARVARALEAQIARWRALVGPVAGTTVYMLGGLDA
jgi:hypothetical protein